VTQYGGPLIMLVTEMLMITENLMIIMIVSLVISAIIFIVFCLKSLVLNYILRLKDKEEKQKNAHFEKIRKDIYNVVVNDIFSEKEFLEKKLEEQVCINVAEKKLLEKKLEEQISVNKKNYDSYRDTAERQKMEIKILKDKILTLEEQNIKYIKTIESYLLMSDLKIRDLIENYHMKSAIALCVK